MDIKNTKIALGLAFEIGRTPILHGLHGIGKSSVVRQWCIENGYEMKDVRLGQMADAGDLIGLPEFHTDANGNKNTKFVFPDWFPRKPKTVIFLDEINRSAKDLLQAVFELILDKSLKGVPLPPDCHVVAAANPATDDYAVLDFSDQAFNDRLVHIKFQPTAAEFHAYMRKQFPNSAALAFLQEDTKCLEDGNLQGFTLEFVKPSRRSWEAVMKLEEKYDAGKVDNNVFIEMCQGIVGQVVAVAYNCFKKTFVSSIKATDVMTDYNSVRPNLKKVMEKGRNDIIANLLDQFNEEFAKRDGLELSEALNIVECMKDLTPEYAYTLATIVVKANNCCSNVKIPKGVKHAMSEGAGLLDYDPLIDLFAKVKQLREEGKKEIEAAKTKVNKAKKEEV